MLLTSCEHRGVALGSLIMGVGSVLKLETKSDPRTDPKTFKILNLTIYLFNHKLELGGYKAEMCD